MPWAPPARSAVSLILGHASILHINRWRIGVHIRAHRHALAPNNPHDLARRLKVNILAAPRIACCAENDAAGVHIAQRHHRLAHVARLAALPEVRQFAAVGPLREKTENLTHPVFDKLSVVFGVGRGSRSAGCHGLRCRWLQAQIPWPRGSRPDCRRHGDRPRS